MPVNWLKFGKYGCLCVVLVTVMLLSFKISKISVTQETSIIQTPDNGALIMKDAPSMYSDVYQQRTKLVHEVCEEEKLNTNFSSQKTLKYSQEYRIVYRLIPKIGSTSFLTVFSILNDRNTGDILTESRQKVHKQTKQIVDKETFDMKTLERYTVLFPSRDPYTRLFSAFIDKVYIFNNMGFENTNNDRHLSGLQKYNVSFQIFLDYALVKPDSPLGGHYNSIFIRNTWLCSLQRFIVIKQETFTADLEYALRAVKVENHKMNAIHNALDSGRAEISVTGIVKTLMKKLPKIVRKMDQSKEKSKRFKAYIFVLNRLWTSFQIQGFINVESKFPFEQFLSYGSKLDVDNVLAIFLDEIKHHPLTHSESLQQRRQSLISAYDNIKDDTVAKIQDVYELDFKAFGYTFTPPE